MPVCDHLGYSCYRAEKVCDCGHCPDLHNELGCYGFVQVVDVGDLTDEDNCDCRQYEEDVTHG